MTINKILPNYTDWNQRIFGDKINELVDAVNSLTGGEKEYKDFLTGEKIRGINEGLRKADLEIEKTFEEKEKYDYRKCMRYSPEPKSNTLRDTLVIKYGGITNDKYLIQEILSLVKEHLEKEINDHEYFCDEYGCDTAVKRIIKNL